MATDDEIVRILGPGGVLEQRISGFTSREGQLLMARGILEAIEGRGQAVFEGGTGLGKTYAYLVPILLSNAKAVISTGTRNLQDQLFVRDLPVLCRALDCHPDVKMLKGRSNYLCRLRLQRAQEAELALPVEWKQVMAFVDSTHDGNLDDLPAVDDKAELLRQLASTRENCPVRECEHYDRCFFYHARREARGATITIVNHHLYLSDFMLRESDRGEILPEPDVLVFDEAHHVPEVAVKCFGQTVSSQAIVRQLDGVLKEVGIVAPGSGGSQDELKHLKGMHRRMVSQASSLMPKTDRTLSIKELDPVKQDVGEFCSSVGFVTKRLQQAGDLPADIKGMVRGLAETTEHLQNWIGGLEDGDSDVPMARWASLSDSGMQFVSAPVDVSGLLGPHLGSGARATVFTSATLSVDGSFGSFSSSLGLDDPMARIWNSPFNFDDCARLFVPHMPVPQRGSDAEHSKSVVSLVCELAVENRGRTFALFTSLRAMRDAARQLESLLEPHSISLLVQGKEESNARLLERFRDNDRSVLLGSQSFATGVDVKGPSLSLVVFDKLPFIPPSDPLHKAREDLCRSKGMDSFSNLQIPHAALCLKQAAGRLIRDTTDRGVFVVCDPRLINKSYGRAILNSLPPMKLTRDIEEAKRMLRSVP